MPFDTKETRRAAKKTIDGVVDGLDAKLGSIAARHLDFKKVKPHHALEAYAMHLKNIDPATVAGMSADDVAAHADNFFHAAAQAHPTLAHVQSTPTSRELKKKFGVSWGD